MNLIRRKLKSEDGASLMLALLFFVICAMVGSVILSAATAAAGRIAGLKNSDQAKYSLESTAKLLQANIEGWTYVRRPVLALDPAPADPVPGEDDETDPPASSSSEGGTGSPTTSPSEGGTDPTTTPASEGGTVPTEVMKAPPEDLVLIPGAALNAADHTNSFELNGSSTALNCISPFLSSCKNLSNVRKEEDKAGCYGRDPFSVTEEVKHSTTYSNQPYFATAKYYLSLTDDDKFKTVIAELKMDYDYTVYIDLSVAEEPGEGVTDLSADSSMPSLMMTFNADYTEQVGTVLHNGIQVETVDVNVKWGSPIMIVNEKTAVGTT